MNNFKVGDKIKSVPGSSDFGEILSISETRVGIKYAFIKWHKGPEEWFSASNLDGTGLEPHKEPLKYSTGEEPRVGDLIYHDQVQAAEVVEIQKGSLLVFNIRLSTWEIWSMFDKIHLRKRRGC